SSSVTVRRSESTSPPPEMAALAVFSLALGQRRRPSMRSVSFRSKLLLAMMLVVVGGTGATMLVTQRSVDASYRRLSRQQFETEVALFSALQNARLAAVKSRSL